MIDKVKQYLEQVAQHTIANTEEVEAFRIQYLGKNGLIPALFKDFTKVPKEARKEMGILLNKLKTEVANKIDSVKEQLEEQSMQTQGAEDLFKPVAFNVGSRHPLAVVRQEIIDIFSRIGFTVSEGPEIEDDWHNFSSLNFPEEHPARDMQDTFFVEKHPDIALRTHTSSVQVRVMENNKPPIRSIFPGRVFRNEAISARAHCIFHQVEGLYVAENVSFADLKQTLMYFAKEMFGKDTGIRLRPSYFPFTEPSAEMDISCHICGGEGCNICKYTGWVEILGCGMVDTNVLKNAKINIEKFTGFAFGMGIERIAMLKYQVNDLRLFFENDIRFLKQFESTL